MLEPPPIKNESIISYIHNTYGLQIELLVFLPLGADLNTSVFKASCADGNEYFVKLRSGAWNKASVTIPNYLSQAGLKHVIPTLKTRYGRSWGKLNGHYVIVFPFIVGCNGQEQKMTSKQWNDFGATLGRIHSFTIPAKLKKDIPWENFSSTWIDDLNIILSRLSKEIFNDPYIMALASYFQSKENVILKLINQTKQLRSIMQTKTHSYVLCHADIHHWNILIEDKTKKLYVVDWDTLIYAPKERDLMFIGAGINESGYTHQIEKEMFYKGYGDVSIDIDILNYYRGIRIIEDLVVDCKQIFQISNSKEERKMSMENIRSNFKLNGTIDVALQLF